MRGQEGIPRAPRVLVNGVVLAQPRGGVRRHHQELLPRAARLLAEGGGSLTLVEGREPARLDLPPSIERLRADVPPHPTWRRAASEGRALRRLLAERPRAFDLVVTGHLPAPSGLPLPLCQTVHDTRRVDLARGPRRLLGERLLRSAVSRAGLVVTVSEATAARLRALGARRVCVVGNGGDHLPLLPRAPADTPFLLHVGHLEPRKNVELLLDALALDPGLPPLWLAGAAKGRHAERLATRAKRLGVAGRLRWLPPTEDEELAALYARAACVVVPSLLEGFGIVALEALRAAAPLAVSEDRALRELAPDAPRFSPRDAAACTRAVRAALGERPPVLEERAARARARTWERAARALVAAWCEAAAPERPGP